MLRHNIFVGCEFNQHRNCGESFTHNGVFYGCKCSCHGTLAEQNRKDFDKFVESEKDIELDDAGLYTRVITSFSEVALHRTMERLTGSFSFECKEIILENGFGYEVSLPRIIIDTE